ncbi:MAG: Vitamin B12 dependent methionine synthase activation subunit [Clostridia bacterium]|nr:Vitamin B12 dependent methionine synthase activation subunit [Clostridia bacterium]
MIEIIKSAAAEINIDPKEVAVYLGYYSAETDKNTDKLIAECTEEFLACADFRACYAEIPVTDGEIDLGFRKIGCSSLKKNLSGCDKAYIFAATTGIEAHRLIERNAIISPLKGIVTDCIGSAAIEAFCDKINLSFENYEYLRPRFSPGYGDMPLECQKDIVEFLQTKKNIGMSLTESLMMVPVKSVTAIIGAGNEKNKCTGPGCMICSGINCPYR